LEKAIEIKRRAQRCIQNGDLDGALAEYEKLVGFEDSDPYNFVLLADLLFKKGEQTGAADRYLSAVSAYEKASLYKNAIAVCKKMSRLSLSPAKVLHALANLHALDGLAGEAALYYVQYAEHMVRTSSPAEAANALRKAFDVCQDNIKVLEQLSEAYVLAGDQHLAAQALVEAAGYYRDRGQEKDAFRVTKRAETLDASVEGRHSGNGVPGAAPPRAHAADATAARGATETGEATQDGTGPGTRDLDLEPTHRGSVAMARPDVGSSHAVEGFESGRHGSANPGGGGTRDAGPAAEGASPDDFAVSEAEIEAYGAVDAKTPAAAAEDGDSTVQFVIDDENLEDDAQVPVVEAPDDEPADGEPVYEIGLEDAAASPYEINAEQAAVEEPSTAEDVVVIEPDADPAPAAKANAPAPAPPALASPAPGLAFGAPGAPAPARHAAPAPAHHGPTTQEIGLQQVEALLTTAQEQFRSGDREKASGTLARAAQAYEVLGRFDSAATIYRSLGRSATVAQSVLELWMINCERRGDKKEAAAVACEMGDRALNGGDEPEAKRWFERAMTFDAQNDTARRRLQRLAGGGGLGGGPIALASAAPAAAPQMEAGRVEVAVGRGEAVTFDLSGLLAEFQRGVEAQLAGDAQSHYDLGMAYREMGLLEQAVDSFRVAVGEPRLAPRALEMIGRCHTDQGRWAEAVGEFRRALQHPFPEGDDGELRFHYAHALVELGETEAALAEYETVARQLPGHEDVDDRIAALRRVLGRA
jgi:tetratricopeptide (TPR) repeat protein